MKYVLSIFLLLTILISGSKTQAQTIENPVNFNNDWKFTLSDSSQYNLTNYDPSKWRSLDLPHDWTIELGFSEELEGCTAFTPGGIGWYSKTFNTPNNNHQRCYILFDGVYNNAEFWINGIKIGDHPFGYAPIYYDLTSLLAPEGQENRISVRVDHSRYADSRWYTGSGIYRNVHLYIVDKLHIPIWGTFITTPMVSNKKATAALQVEVSNTYTEAKEALISTDILDPNGKLVTTTKSTVNLEANSSDQFLQELSIDQPEFWDVDSPVLYKAITKIVSKGRTLETRETKFGIRTSVFDKDKGYFLNGKNIKIKGVCLHHDAGLVGAAVPKDVWKRRLEALKDMGCNAIRTAHNPASDEFLDLCDELGFLVQNEFYDEWDLPKDKRYNMHDKEVDYITRGHSEHFQTWAETDLKNTMKSSRNHPSIFQWSIGNEIEWTYPGNRGATGIFKETNKDDKMDWTLWRTEVPPHTPEQVREFWKKFPKQTFDIGTTASKLAKWTRELDTTRAVTANCILPTSSFETGYTDVLDVVGYSYKPHKYEYFKETYPDVAMMGTENVPRYYEWKAIMDKDYISGIFLWTGVDYMGECRADFWPTKVTPHGPLDIAGFPRGSFYMFKSLWRDDIPVISMYSQTADKSIYKVNKNGEVVEKKKGYWELAPREWQDVNSHWNYEKGTKTIVEVYSNCESVELFQNGISLGKRFLKDQEDYTYKWAVDYKKGNITAKGTKGREITTVSLETAGTAKSIELSLDKRSLSANNTDVLHVTAQLVDKSGKAVNYDDEDITFEITGNHRFLGTDCGNTHKYNTFKSHTIMTEFGKCLLAIQATKESSTIYIQAKNKDGKVISDRVKVEVFSL
ncbi:glycoside hydrolase family 2 TIM barrel-domain containing protein [Reichenbachiella versicolor]|uniref:glycoside hydrolase family 2 TIM barrel-domain containing protein n=1 Tax=Reichenbachiella versicolor TaxID=1821036 RepID=UPI000D6DE60D|nr:glycoside hydrolase family 2 TIM barrel-domain containing protein [Reichenbachiella versicolor]